MEKEIIKKINTSSSYKYDNLLSVNPQTEETLLTFALKFNHSYAFNLSKEEWDYLLENSNLKHINKHSNTPLMAAIIFNEEEKINLTLNQWDFFIRGSDLKIYDLQKSTHLTYFINKKNIKLSNDTWDFIVKNLDFDFVDGAGNIPLLYFLALNKTNSINLSQKQWDYILDNSNLDFITESGLNAYVYYIIAKDTEKLNFTDEQIVKLKNTVVDLDLDKLSYTTSSNVIKILKSVIIEFFKNLFFHFTSYFHVSVVLRCIV